MARPTEVSTKAPPSSISTWTEVEAVIKGIAEENPSIAHDIIEKAQRLAKFSSGRYQTPNEIALGYWPTIQLMWSSLTPPIEIEIFQDHYEFYRFFDGATEILHMAATSDDFPESLKMILDTAILEARVVEIGI